ncbi:MAG TPA: 2Fe-2S iron-sulfur cluster-binding protein [Polyangiaceae bacterium]|nr:2Fe-2S iron-sulfur cluster-binding protein [Polyangiaceae bacterium]
MNNRQVSESEAPGSDQARLVAEARDGRVVEVQAAVGTSLLEASDGPEGPIPFCCRSASCGTCRVEVLEGADCLSQPDDDELDVLSMYAESPDRVRLACQAKLCVTGGSVRVRALEQ